MTSPLLTHRLHLAVRTVVVVVALLLAAGLVLPGTAPPDGRAAVPDTRVEPSTAPASTPSVLPERNLVMVNATGATAPAVTVYRIDAIRTDYLAPQERVALVRADVGPGVTGQWTYPAVPGTRLLVAVADRVCPVPIDTATLLLVLPDANEPEHLRVARGAEAPYAPGLGESPPPGDGRVFCLRTPPAPEPVAESAR
jgi:hypothetical protein